ncbi:MAG TPA: 3'(2'),5'-bisphosphate nucleotidase [Pirellulaceae bacterium]|nr:3'(2'),5'-bisphosphate nucleotidase [Pirellulaceae bacterium]
MNIAWTPELTAACDAAFLAARLCRAVQAGRNAASVEKSDRSPVTIADFGSQALISQTLAERLPQDGIVAEEEGDKFRQTEPRFIEQLLGKLEELGTPSDEETIAIALDRNRVDGTGDRFWTVDPIDGTKGFLRGEQYAVAIALVVNGMVEVGALACPNLPRGPLVAPDAPETLGLLTIAVRGQGAFGFPLDSQGPPPHWLSVPAVRLRVSRQQSASLSRICESVEAAHTDQGDSHRLGDYLGISSEPLRMDSQCKYAAVARGDAEMYVRIPTDPLRKEKIWDHAAGMLIVQEAGGMVTDLAGKPLQYRLGDSFGSNYGVLATNGSLHESALDGLRQLGLAGPAEAEAV